MLSKRLLFVFAASALVISSCVRYAPNPSSNPTPTDLFESQRPLPNDFSLDDLKTGTAAAASGGPTNTPGALITFTPTATATPLLPGVVCTAPACSAGQALTCPSGNWNCPNACGLVCSGVTATLTAAPPLPVGARPPTWTLRKGEFPWCIARRYDVDPTELLRLSGLVEGALYTAGTELKIPQSGFFPGPRALLPHPATYRVISSEETFYSIACLYGDPYPEHIANANGLPLTAVLTAGQSINIPAGSGAAVPAPGIVRPATYILQEGDTTNCVARRFDVDPNQLLTLNGMTNEQGNIPVPGSLLNIPQSGFFPGNRALLAHPASYTVISSAETLNSIACLYGDVDPARIAQANNLSLIAVLTVGRQINIP